MREVITPGTATTVYTYAELSESAQQRAREVIGEKLGGIWWDDDDSTSVEQEMLAGFAEALGGPDPVADDGSVEVAGITVRGWSLDRSQELALNGKLTRENAPGLPWIDSIGYVELEGRRTDTRVYVVHADPECTCSPDHYLQPHDEGCPSLTFVAPTDEQERTVEQAVRDAVHAAWSAGYKEMEYKTSPDSEYVKGIAEDDVYEYTEDGELFN